MLNLHRRHGPSKLIGVSAVFVFFCLAYLYLRDTPFSCDLPLRHAVEQATLFQNDTVHPSKIAKITVAANALNGGIIHRALESHHVQNRMHGYRHFIAANTAVSDLIEHDSKNRPKGAWTKPAYILSVIVAELQKEEADRLEWVFWFDADTIVLNPYTPLEIFTPPPSRRDLDDCHLLISSNWDGLNSGAFALRVHPWSVSLMSAVLAYPIYETERQKKDRFRDQSAFQFLLQNKESPMVNSPTNGKEHWAEIPMRWFNSLPFNNAFGAEGKWIYATNMTDDKFDNGTTEYYNDGGNSPELKPWKVMQGDMAVHFAGATAGSKGVRDSWMGRWIDRAEELLPHWANETAHLRFRQESDDFWDKTAHNIAEMRRKVRVGEKLEIDTSKPPAPARKETAKDKPKEDKPKEEKPKEGKPKEKAREAKPQDQSKPEEKRKAEVPSNGATPKAETKRKAKQETTDTAAAEPAEEAEAEEKPKAQVRPRVSAKPQSPGERRKAAPQEQLDEAAEASTERRGPKGEEAAPIETKARAAAASPEDYT